MHVHIPSLGELQKKKRTSLGNHKTLVLKSRAKPPYLIPTIVVSAKLKKKTTIPWATWWCKHAVGRVSVLRTLMILFASLLFGLPGKSCCLWGYFCLSCVSLWIFDAANSQTQHCSFSLSLLQAAGDEAAPQHHPAFFMCSSSSTTSVALQEQRVGRRRRRNRLRDLRDQPEASQYDDVSFVQFYIHLESYTILYLCCRHSKLWPPHKQQVAGRELKMKDAEKVHELHQTCVNMVKHRKYLAPCQEVILCVWYEINGCFELQSFPKNKTNLKESSASR